MASERIGRVASLHRYPVRSMAGESASELELGKYGVPGDRAYGVVPADRFAMIGAAVEPRRWGELLRFRARYLREPTEDGPPPEIALAREDGEEIVGDLEACSRLLSEFFGQDVELWSGDGRGALGLPARKASAGGERLPELPYGAAPLHLLTTASLAEAGRLHPEGEFDAARFRPNLVVETSAREGFVEASWVGRAIRIGDAIELGVFQECERCVETTLAQGELPRDPAVLETVVKHNRQNLGVYLGVTSGGRVRVGDEVVLVDAAG